MNTGLLCPKKMNKRFVGLFKLQKLNTKDLPPLLQLFRTIYLYFYSNQLLQVKKTCPFSSIPSNYIQPNPSFTYKLQLFLIRIHLKILTNFPHIYHHPTMHIIPSLTFLIKVIFNNTSFTGLQLLTVAAVVVAMENFVFSFLPISHFLYTPISLGK